MNFQFLIWSRHCWWSLHKCYFCVILLFWQALVVIQDLLRVFVIRIACQNAKYASMLIKPALSSVIHHVSESSCPSDTDAYKVRFLSVCLPLKFGACSSSSVTFWWVFLLHFQVLRLLDFLVSLLEHPLGKVAYFYSSAFSFVLVFYFHYDYFDESSFINYCWLLIIVVYNLT